MTCSLAIFCLIRVGAGLLATSITRASFRVSFSSRVKHQPHPKKVAKETISVPKPYSAVAIGSTHRSTKWVRTDRNTEGSDTILR